MTANTKRAVLGEIRGKRAARENALGDYVDALLAVHTAELDLAAAKQRRDQARAEARDRGNTAAELDEAARIVRARIADDDHEDTHGDTHGDGADGAAADGQPGQPGQEAHPW